MHLHSLSKSRSLFLGIALSAATGAFAQTMPDPAPMPELPPPQAPGSVEMGDPAKFPEVKMDFPIAEGPYGPTWDSIARNYPAKEVAWLREAKFGIWVHFGPQAAGQSGDWYARRMYMQGQRAYSNHLRDFGHPSTEGYKDLLKDWNPTKLDPAALVQSYRDAGARFLLIQGVHHDNFDSWDSKYQPWNSVNMGPKRDLLGEWSAAAKKAGMCYGVSFHHEYTWWWWQKSLGSDKTGDKAGVPYDGNLTLADGKGKWWERFDLRLLYGVDLREYRGFDQDGWCPKQGILVNHLEYAHWYATQWALRIMDVINKYDPDFIYTDGNSKQPFDGRLAATGYKCDAMQRVIANFYNRTLEFRKQMDTFSIVKFHPPCPGVVTTFEAKWPEDIKTDQPWIGETPYGDWYYAPGFHYSAAALIRYMLECVARDGSYCVNIAMLPDGSLDDGCRSMLKETGDWMNINGPAIYGSHAWLKLGEGANGKLNVLPAGGIGASHANFKYSPQDFRFTVGKDGSIYAFCMTVPEASSTLKIASLGTDAKLLNSPIKTVSLLGSNEPIAWQQKSDGLEMTCPAAMPFKIAVTFKVTCALPAQTAEAAAKMARGILSGQDLIAGIKQTTKGNPNVLAIAGDFGGPQKEDEQPVCAIDGDKGSKYFNSAVGGQNRGVDAGFVVTPKAGATVATGIRFCTANDVNGRDPIAITVEGSNDPDAIKAGASAFRVIYEGSCGLDQDPGRNTWGQTISFQNASAYKSYRILVTKSRDEHADAVQYSEVALLGSASE